jgi:dihydroorotase
MNMLIRNARIICPGSNLHGLQKDILISQGFIQQIGDNLPVSGETEFALPGLHVSPGWMDIFSFFGEPGFEYRETFASGSGAAAAGGFTDILLMPNSRPPVSNRTQVEYVLSKAAALPINLHPAASASKDNSGKELAEMYDLHQAGAIAFSDGIFPVQNSDLLLKALQYVKAIGAVVIQVPDDKQIQPGGLMHEGIASTRLGLPGKASLGEEMMVSRCIDLLRYTGSRIHLTGISTAGSIDLIRRAKEEGLDISCSVTPYHLHFSDEDLAGYDTHLKTEPPLRTTIDRKKLIEALKDGTIDFIASHHMPLHIDEKNCEFERALPGMSGLESCFGAVNKVLDNIDLLIKMMYQKPREMLGLPIPKIETGAKACLTLFDPEIDLPFENNMIRSLSHNNAFAGKMLKGKVYGIINKGHIILNP